MKLGQFGLLAVVAIVCCAIAAPAYAVSCGNGDSCPSGQCCGLDNQCGTTAEFCASGCQPEWGRCTGYFHNLTVAMTAASVDVIDVVYHPSDPVVYVFINVIGPVNITQGDGTLRQYPAFAGMNDYSRGMIVQYDTRTMDFQTYAQYGTFLQDTQCTASESFTFVRALWANNTLWAAYNLAPLQGTPSGACVAFYSQNNEASDNFLIPEMGNTGVLRIQTSNLIPAPPSVTVPTAFAFPNLTSTDFYFDGADLHLTGSFSMSPLQLGHPFDIDENFGVRGSCDNATRAYNEEFRWCPGAEDGWNLKLKVVGAAAALTGPHYVLSQATGGPVRHVTAVSSSGDNSGAVYQCYVSNNDYVVLATNGDTDIVTDNTTVINRTETVPPSNDQLFCTLRSDNTFSFTSVAFDGEVTALQASAMPGTSLEVLSTATVSDMSTGASRVLINITGVQGVGEELGYVLQEGPNYARISSLYSTSHHEVIATGVFNGTLSGDPLNPIPNVIGHAELGSMFLWYYRRGDSPSQIAPSNVWSFVRNNVNFESTRAIIMPESTPNHPSLLMVGKIVATQLWTYNNTFYLPTPAGTKGIFWGILEPTLDTVAAPIFDLPPPAAPTTTTPPSGGGPPPSGEPTGHAGSTFNFSILLGFTALLLLSLVSLS